MKITVGIVSSNSYGTPYTDLDVKLEPTKEEHKLLTQFGVPIPGENSQNTYSLLKRCFSTHGDFFREAGISNFRTFQPDWAYFKSSSSNGWNKFMNRLVASEDRDDVLHKIANLISNKLSLLTENMPRVVHKTNVKNPKQETKKVKLVDLSGKTLELRVGDKFYQLRDVKENAKANTLIKNTIDEVVNKANDQITSFEAEFSDNLTLMSNQYEKELKELKHKLQSQLPALQVSEDLLEQGVVVSSPGNEYRIYAPIHLHYKYVATRFHVWDLKKEFQREQDGYLMVAVDGAWNYKWSWIYDKHFSRDGVEMFHCMGHDLCLGSYKMSVHCLHDILKVSKDIAKMYETINVESMSVENLHTDSMCELFDVLEDGPHKEYEVEIEGKKQKVTDWNYNAVATLKIDKTTEDGGRIWST